MITIIAIITIIINIIITIIITIIIVIIIVIICAVTQNQSDPSNQDPRVHVYKLAYNDTIAYHVYVYSKCMQMYPNVMFEIKQWSNLCSKSLLYQVYTNYIYILYIHLGKEKNQSRWNTSYRPCNQQWPLIGIGLLN